MGCDIHLHVEVKIKGKWHHYSLVSIKRNYKLFAKMAGVRNYDEIEPLAEPRGLPEDATELTAYDAARWKGDAHSASWLSAEEIHRLDEWGKTVGFKGKHGADWWMEEFGFDYLFGNSHSGFSEFPQDRPPGMEDLRFVFWFDC